MKLLKNDSDYSAYISEYKSFGIFHDNMYISELKDVSSGGYVNGNLFDEECKR